MPLAMWIYLGVLVVPAWSCLNLPKHHGFISGDETVFRCVRFLIDAETVVVRDRNKDGELGIVTARIAADLIANEESFVVASGNRGEVVRVYRSIVRPSGKLTFIVYPLKASTDRGYPRRTLAEIPASHQATSGLIPILRTIRLKQPSSLTTNGNFSLFFDGAEQTCSDDDIESSQNNHQDICALNPIPEPSDNALALACMLGGLVLVSSGAICNYLLDGWAIAASGFILLVVGLFLACLD
jgi:hypothetical protein